jgi:hypothetical protein
MKSRLFLVVLVLTSFFLGCNGYKEDRDKVFRINQRLNKVDENLKNSCNCDVCDAKKKEELLERRNRIKKVTEIYHNPKRLNDMLRDSECLERESEECTKCTGG